MAEYNIYIEMTVYDSVEVEEITLYFSIKPKNTKSDDVPAEVTYIPAVVDPGNLERNIYRDGYLGGISSISAGFISLANPDGALDHLIDYGFDGRRVVIKRGEALADVQDATVVFTGVMDQPEFTNSLVNVRVMALKNEFWDLPMQTAKYDGTNSLPSGLDGVEDIEGNPIPWLFGRRRNFDPPCVNTSRHIYQISHRAIAAVVTVWDKGTVLPLDTSGSSVSARASLAAFQAYDPIGGQYNYYLGSSTEGAYIRLGAEPDGLVTCHAYEGATAADRTVAQIARRIMETVGDVDSGDIDGDDDLDLVADGEAGIWVKDEKTIGEVVDPLVQGVLGFIIDTIDGDFEIGRLEIPSGTSVRSFFKQRLITEGDAPFERLALSGDHHLPIYKVIVRYAPNDAVMTDNDLSGVALADKADFNKEFYEVVVEDLAIKVIHKNAKELIIETDLIDKADAENVGDHALALHGPRRDRIRISVNTDCACAVELNRVVDLDIERFDWSGGKLFRIIGLVQLFGSFRGELELWG